jgi:hypothetical protein
MMVKVVKPEGMSRLARVTKPIPVITDTGSMYVVQLPGEPDTSVWYKWRFAIVHDEDTLDEILFSPRGQE